MTVMKRIHGGTVLIQINQLIKNCTNFRCIVKSNKAESILCDYFIKISLIIILEIGQNKGYIKRFFKNNKQNKNK